MRSSIGEFFCIIVFAHFGLLLASPVLTTAKLLFIFYFWLEFRFFQIAFGWSSPVVNAFM